MTDSSATVSGSTETGGGPVNAHVEFGTTTAYGSVTPNQRLDALAAGRTFSAALTGLPAGYHDPLPRGREHRFRDDHRR